MSIYKECDIRGIYPSELNEEIAYNIGRAIARFAPNKSLALGGDVRLSTPVLKSRMREGLLDGGITLVDIGILPTPVFYFAIKHLQLDGGVMVTASHNPPRYNGFKLMLGKYPVTPEDIGKIEELAQETNFEAKIPGKYSEIDVQEAYKQHIAQHFPRLTTQQPLKIVVDAGNGATSALAPEILTQMGYQVIPLFCEFDGSFPNRDPNPAVYSHLEALCTAVKESKADLGAAFDGDGDRVVFVDEQGQVVPSEKSFVLLIHKFLAQKPQPVVYDLKSSLIVPQAISQLGGTPLPEKSGHAYIKKTFLENKAALGGEISGHFFFEALGYDDGLYATLVLGNILTQKKQPLSALVTQIPTTFLSPDLRLACPYDQRDHKLAQLLQKAQEAQLPVTKVDGIRIVFPQGWLLVRKSVTEEAITIRFEAETQKSWEEIYLFIQKIFPEIALEL